MRNWNRCGHARRSRHRQIAVTAGLTILLLLSPLLAAAVVDPDAASEIGTNPTPDAEVESDATTEAAGAVRPVLATPGQLEREALVVEILKSPAMARATDALEQTYLADARGATPSGRATARRAAESTAAAAANAAVNEDPSQPVVFWGAAAPHAWYGLTLPRSGYGIENPDNVYRSFRVDGASRYRVRGRIREPGPVELHFVVMDMRPAQGKIQVEGGTFVASLRSDAMEIADDGSFTIEIDSAPADGRRNHLQVPAAGRFPVHVRDLLSDWSRQNPASLEISRISGPAAPPPVDLETLAARAAEHLSQMGPFWLAYNNQHLYSEPANTFKPPRLRPGGRGISASGHFTLAADEALIVTLESLGARSISIQLADPWGVAYEYVDRTSSLNQDQAVANPDGSFTCVIAAQDPLVHNWLDPDGQSSGIFVARWQVLTGEPDPAAAIREIRVVRREDLLSALPAGTRTLTPEARATQRAERARQFRRRVEP